MDRKGQSVLEYTVFVAVVLAALLAMRTYLQRGVQGKLRESSDKIGEQFSADNTTMTRTTQQIGESKTKEQFGGNVSSGGVGRGVSLYNVTQPANITRTTYEEVANFSTESLF